MEQNREPRNKPMHIWSINIHTHNGVLFSLKRKEILPLVTTWMNMEGIMLGEVSQTEKDK